LVHSFGRRHENGPEHSLRYFPHNHSLDGEVSRFGINVPE
jgi:hypothetical protein